MVGSSSHSAETVHRYYIHAFSKGDVIGCPVKRIRAEEVEQAISAHFSNIVLKGNYLDAVAEKIFSQIDENSSSVRAVTNALRKELMKTTNEMEKVFSLHLNAQQGTETAKFLFEKIEILGQKKTSIEARLNLATKDDNSNVVSLNDVRGDLENRIQLATKGWSKLPNIQKKRALRKFVQKILVGESGLDIYYYANAVSSESSLGAFSKETQNVAKVLPFISHGTQLKSKKLDPKQWVENCVSARLVTPVRFERTTLALEGRCSIQLSYGAI